MHQDETRQMLFFLLHVVYKIITEVLTDRFNPKLVGKVDEQSVAFI